MVLITLQGVIKFLGWYDEAVFPIAKRAFALPDRGRLPFGATRSQTDAFDIKRGGVGSLKSDLTD